MTAHCIVTLGNISCGTTQQRVFESKNAAFIWLNHQLCRLSANSNIHELYFRVESYRPELLYDSASYNVQDPSLPF